jgi:hypothetical protein
LDAVGLIGLLGLLIVQRTRQQRVCGFKHSGLPKPVCVCGLCGSFGEVDLKVGLLAAEVVEQCNPMVVDSAY